MEIKCINDYKTVLKCAKIHSELANMSLVENGLNLIDDKHVDEKHLLCGVNAIMQTVGGKLFKLLETTDEHIDLMFIGEIESILSIVDWILINHRGVLRLLADEGRAFDSEFLKLKKIIAKYMELEKVLNVDLC
nr:MAG TPA: hypothetical protein [Caudoviricetes sp.]